MRQSRTTIDWGVLLVLAFSLIATWPFILQPGLPRTNDSERYVFLTSDYAQSFRESRLYPRWSAHAVEGYGAPIPHFYPPATPYLAGTIDVLLTNDPVNAVRLLYIIAMCLAGTTTYAFIQRFRGATSAIIGSFLYVYSPHLGLNAPHILGDLNGVLAMALLPTMMWGVQRLLNINGPFDFALVSLTSSAFLLTDPAFWALSQIILILPVGYYARTATGQRGRILRVILSLLLGPALAAFYWIPAMLDYDKVRWVSQPIPPAEHMLSLRHLLTPLPRVDLNELVVRPHFTLGVSLTLTIIIVVVATMRGRIERSLDHLFLGGGISLLLIGTFITPTSAWLMGPSVFLLSVGASAIGSLLSKDKNGHHRQLPLLLGLYILLSIPVLLAPRWPEQFGTTTQYDQITYEKRGWGIASLPSNAQIPVSVNLPLPSQRFLAGEYQSPNINRITPDQIAADRQGSLLASRTHMDQFQVNIAESSTLTVLRSYFPGWQARLGGESLAVSPQVGTNLTNINISGNQSGELVLAFGPTLERRQSWLVSWLTLCVIAIVTLLRMRHGNTTSHMITPLITIDEARLVSIVYSALFALVTLFVAPNAPFSLHARPGHGLDNTIAVQSRTETGLKLISYDIDNIEFHSGDTLELTLAWHTVDQVDTNFQTYIHIRDIEQNVRWQQGDAQHPGNYPTTRWINFAYVKDTHRLTLSPTIPPGTYQIAVEIGICDPECLDMRRLTFVGPDNQQYGQILTLPSTITLLP